MGEISQSVISQLRYRLMTSIEGPGPATPSDIPSSLATVPEYDIAVVGRETAIDLESRSPLQTAPQLSRSALMIQVADEVVGRSLMTEDEFWAGPSIDPELLTSVTLPMGDETVELQYLTNRPRNGSLLRIRDNFTDIHKAMCESEYPNPGLSSEMSGYEGRILTIGDTASVASRARLVDAYPNEPMYIIRSAGWSFSPLWAEVLFVP